MKIPILFEVKIQLTWTVGVLPGGAIMFELRFNRFIVTIQRKKSIRSKKDLTGFLGKKVKMAWQ